MQEKQYDIQSFNHTQVCHTHMHKHIHAHTCTRKAFALSQNVGEFSTFMFKIKIKYLSMSCFEIPHLKQLTD